jgi:t-SNARE complex subunit (syntaxin)
VAVVQERRQQVLQLTSSLEELYSIMQDLAFLVQEQGTMLDVIEANMEETKVGIKRGNEAMEAAVRYNASARKKAMLACLGGAGGLALLSKASPLKMMGMGKLL